MQETADEQDGENKGGGVLTLERAMSAVRKRLRLVLAVPAVLAVATAALVLMLPNRYDADALVQINPRQKVISDLDTVVSDLKGDNATVESEVEIIRSRPVILSVIDALDLRNDPEFERKPRLTQFMEKIGFPQKGEPRVAEREVPIARDQIAEILNPQQPGSSLPERDEVAVAFAERLKVVRVRTTLLIDIRFSAQDPVKAAKIANTIAETYLRQQIEVKRRANAAATEILETKIEEMRGKVAAAERAVEQWKARNNIFDSEGQILSEKQLARLMEQSVNARNATAEARARYEQAQKLARAGDSGTAIADVLKSPTVQALKDQLASTRRKGAELATRYGPKHPELVKIRAEMEEAQAQLSAEIERLVINLKNEYEVADARERQLAQNLAQMKEQQADTKDAGVELKELEREAATSKQLFEALLTRYKHTSGTQDFQLPDATIVEKADVPLHPASPKRKQLVMMASAAGLLLGCALAVLLEIFAPGVSRPEDIKRALALDHLSSMPAIAQPDGPALAPDKAVRLIVAEPSGVYAEATRSARRELDTRRRRPGPRIILVTSALPKEGADIVASNLAHHYAMTGTRVLLADADWRRQPLTQQLAPQRLAGFADQLIAYQSVEAAVLRDGMTGLHFLPAAAQGTISGSIPELLASQVTADALFRLRAAFDVVVLSAPPLLPVSDARILADYADQIVFVMMWQATPKALAKKALMALGANQPKVAGVIMSEVADETEKATFPMMARADEHGPLDSRQRAA